MSPSWRTCMAFQHAADARGQRLRTQPLDSALRLRRDGEDHRASGSRIGDIEVASGLAPGVSASSKNLTRRF